MAAKYIKRHAEQLLTKVGRMFGSVLVTGPRQVGKTTMMRHCLDTVRYVTLDDTLLFQQAIENPRGFMSDNPYPLFVDEIQKAPGLFPLIKMAIDSERKKGMYFLSGSQQMQMMHNVSETMSGRVGIVNLLPLSMRELYGSRSKEVRITRRPFVPTSEFLSERLACGFSTDSLSVWQHIHRGLMPEVACDDDIDWQIYYASYVKTYIERDVRALTQIGDETKFIRFMTATAAYTGQVLNLSSLAREVGISQPTAERWLSVLVASHIVYLLQPFSGNIMSRLVKSPKLYFLDTGLVAYLTRWSNPEVLRLGAMSGAVFETFVVAEIIKSYYNQGIEPPLWLYRDRYSEIDLLIETDGRLHPVEIKKRAEVSKGDIRAFAKLDDIPGDVRGEGCVICTADRLMSLTDRDKIVPVGLL